MINCGKVEPCIGCPAVALRNYQVQPGETIIKKTGDSFTVASFNRDPVEIGGILVRNESFEQTNINDSRFRHDIAACDSPEISTEIEVHGRWPFKFVKVLKKATCLALHETITLSVTNG